MVDVVAHVGVPDHPLAHVCIIRITIPLDAIPFALEQKEQHQLPSFQIHRGHGQDTENILLFLLVSGLREAEALQRIALCLLLVKV